MASIFDRRRQQPGTARQFGAPGARTQRTNQQNNGYSGIASGNLNLRPPNSSGAGNSFSTGAAGDNFPTFPNEQPTNGQPGKPGAYQSPYSTQINNLIDQILNRDPFKYDLNADMLYQQYRDQYQRAGLQAMQDTMGQAATMTGGYGNSYASTAGNQAYQQWMQELNNIIPELYDRAYGYYNQEYQDLMNQYSMLMNAEQFAYGQHQDSFNNYMAMLGFENQQNQQNQQQQNTQNQNLANAGWELLGSGVMPTAEQLAAMGITEEQAESIINNNRRPGRNGGSGGGSGNNPGTNPPQTGGFWNNMGIAAQSMPEAFSQLLAETLSGWNADNSTNGGSTPGRNPANSTSPQENSRSSQMSEEERRRRARGWFDYISRR